LGQATDFCWINGSIVYPTNASSRNSDVYYRLNYEQS
jgi:hypothetical protein